MIDLGKYKGRKVTTDQNALENHHIAVIGASGSGKSVECQRIISSIVQQGGTVLAFDIHGTLSEDQIFWKYSPIFEQYVNEIDVRKEGIPCNLFTPLVYPDGTEEDAVDLIGNLTDVLSDSIRIGSAQKAELRKALAYICESGEYEEYGFSAVDTALKGAGNKAAIELREKLHFLTAHNIFRPGGEMFCSGKINVFRLSRFSLKTQCAVAELVLMYLWRLANAEQFKSKEIFIFVDEFQNLPSGKDSALAQMLSEGRKFGVNLILASQMVLQGTTSAVQQRITQSALMLYFKPAANRVSMTAKLIEETSDSDWRRLLRTLNIGEFIAVGSFLVDGRCMKGALKISAVEEKSSEDTQKKAFATHEYSVRDNRFKEEE